MTAWVPVSTSQLAQLIEIETEEDGKLPFASVTLHFPGTTALKFCSLDNQSFCEEVPVEGVNFLAPHGGWGVSKRYIAVSPTSDIDCAVSESYIAVSPTSDIKYELKKSDIECKDMVLLGMKLDTTEAQVREYFKDVEVLGVHMMQSKNNRTKYAFIKFSDWEVAKVLGRQMHCINGMLCSFQQHRHMVGRNSGQAQVVKRKRSIADFGEVDACLKGKVGRVEGLEQRKIKRKEQVQKMKSMILPLRDEIVRQKSVLEENFLLLSKKGEEIKNMKEEIAAKDQLIEEQTKLITSLAVQVEKAGQINEEQKEELEANKTKLKELEIRSRWCPPSWCSKCLLDKCWCPPGSTPVAPKPSGWLPPNPAPGLLPPMSQGVPTIWR